MLSGVKTPKRLELVCVISKPFQWHIVLFEKAKPQLEVFVDACVTGIGAYWEDNAYAVSRNFNATNGFNITKLEMLNVLIALRIFGNMWENLNVKFCVDNKASVCALQKDRIRYPLMQAVARSVWLIAASKGISLVYDRISGTENCIADAFSRAFDSNGSSLKNSTFNMVAS